METDMPSTPPLSSAKGKALQLVKIEGKVFQVNEGVLKETLEKEKVKDLPVCVISIFGEHRKGKSFLLNYLRRRLEHEVNQESLGNQKKPQDPWRGKNEEILEGFEWHSGVVVSRGLWIWSKPFILKGKSEKEVAVFLLDTEGTMDVAGDKENGVKISTLSMLFSSYLILNVNEKLREPDLEYLEMTLDLMKDAFPEDVQNLHLDLMMGDWHNWHECSEEHGKKYLKDTVKREMLGEAASIREMDPEFKACFLKYINLLHSKAKEHTKSKMKCRELAKLIKEIASIIKNTSYNISSPAEMSKVILELQKRRFIDDFCEWRKMKISQTIYLGFYFTRPSKLKSQFEEEFENRSKKVKINEETQNHIKILMDSYFRGIQSKLL